MSRLSYIDKALSSFTGSAYNCRTVNYINIHCTLLIPNEENATVFNNLLTLCKKHIKYNIKRTRSGGISHSHMVNVPAYSYTYGNSGAELLILTNLKAYRIQFRPQLANNAESDNKAMSGRQAFAYFKKMCGDYGIDLSAYAVDNGKEIKQEIEKPLIKMENPMYISHDETANGLRSAHHIDFHNSYPGGLVRTHPEFKPLITELYNRRKENPVYKAILNYTIGFMQSKWCGYKYAALSRDAINDNNNRVRDLAQRLKKTGHNVVAYNTDGIWYTGKVYHGEGEGTEVGQWHNDHINCRLRFKSAGSYEYIENGKYYPVVRGYTNLDKIKTRDQWSWGDIYKAGIITYKLTTDGIVADTWEGYK